MVPLFTAVDTVGFAINGEKLTFGAPITLYQLPQPENIQLTTGLVGVVNGGWVVILNRFDGSLKFNRGWGYYNIGFGSKFGEFWEGNEGVYRLIKGHGYNSLRVEVQLKTSGRWFYADYDNFSLDSVYDNATIHVSGYSGDAGDSLTNTKVSEGWFHDGMKFSTYDKDNDKSSSNCAKNYNAGWWFNDCWMSCLTCEYGKNFAWVSLKHREKDGLLRAARMLIRKK
jgi:hypothetical protein